MSRCVVVPLTAPIGSMVRLVAPVTVQLRVAVCPVVIQEGLTAKLPINGGCPTDVGGDDPPPPQPAAPSPMQANATARVANCRGRSMSSPREVRLMRNAHANRLVRN